MTDRLKRDMAIKRLKELRRNTPMKERCMYEFFASNQLYIVMAIVLINWFGLLVYLFRMDSRVSKLERNLQSKENSL
jgi:CcmD family protein